MIQKAADPRDTACVRNPELFDAYPRRHGGAFQPYNPADWEHVRTALDLCHACPQLTACRIYANENRDIHGVIAGQYRPWF